MLNIKSFFDMITGIFSKTTVPSQPAIPAPIVAPIVLPPPPPVVVVSAPIVVPSVDQVIKGIDISVIQGAINFQVVANTGIKFIVARCGVGNDGSDILYTKNMAGAKAAGLLTMCYHFVYPLPSVAGTTGRDPVSQANAHFKASNGEISAIDFEWPEPSDFAKWGCSVNQINDWMLSYLQTYTQLSGRKPLIYTYPYFAQALNPPSDFAQYKLWIASYAATPVIPKPWQDYSMWQTTGGGGKLPSGAPVDTDVCKDMSIWIK